MIFGKKLKIVSKKIDNEPVYNKKYLKDQVNSYNGKININFHNNKIPKEGSQYICLSVILIDSGFRTSKSYYPLVFLKNVNMLLKEKKIPEYIIDEIEISSDSDRENSDRESSDDENSDEGNSDREY